MSPEKVPAGAGVFRKKGRAAEPWRKVRNGSAEVRLGGDGGDGFDGGFGADEIVESTGGGFQFPVVGFRVHGGEAEGGFVAVVPFVVVGEGPGKVATDVVAIADRSADGRDVVLH